MLLLSNLQRWTVPVPVSGSHPHPLIFKITTNTTVQCLALRSSYWNNVYMYNYINLLTDYMHHHYLYITILYFFKLWKAVSLLGQWSVRLRDMSRCFKEGSGFDRKNQLPYSVHPGSLKGGLITPEKTHFQLLTFLLQTFCGSYSFLLSQTVLKSFSLILVCCSCMWSLTPDF